MGKRKSRLPTLAELIGIPDGMGISTSFCVGNDLLCLLKRKTRAPNWEQKESGKSRKNCQ